MNYEYLCPKREIVATFAELWGVEGDYRFASFVAVLSDWVLKEDAHRP